MAFQRSDCFRRNLEAYNFVKPRGSKRVFLAKQRKAQTKEIKVNVRRMVNRWLKLREKNYKIERSWKHALEVEH